MTRSLPATFMRGGTSKALMFRTRDLPRDKGERDDLLLAAMGSPDPYGRQLNGMGGGLSSLSKVCIVGEPTHGEAEVDFTFAQVQIKRRLIDYSGNCGNMSAAVAPFALAAGLLARNDGETSVVVHNTNTHKLMCASFEVVDGLAREEGNLVVPGVSGSGAPVRLDFLDPGGSATGMLLPSGCVRDELHTAEGTFTVSMIDAGNACVFVSAAEVGLTGVESPEQIDSRPDTLRTLESIRAQAAAAMGLVRSVEEASSRPLTPFVAIVAPPRDYTSSDGRAIRGTDHDLTVRFISNGQPHRAIPGTGALCLAVAIRIEETVAYQATRPAHPDQALRLGTPAGVVPVDARVDHPPGAGWKAVSATSYRTFRRLFVGQVFV